MIIVIYVVSITISLLAVFLIDELSDYSWCREQSDQMISFETFLNLSAIAPDKWTMKDDGRVFYEGNCLIMQNLIDHMKYRFYWRKILKKRNHNIFVVNRIKQWQNDIENYTNEMNVL